MGNTAFLKKRQMAEIAKYEAKLIRESQVHSEAGIEEFESQLLKEDNRESITKAILDEPNPTQRRRKRDFFKSFFSLRRARIDQGQSQLGFCAKIKDCGHSCKGLAGEKKCMPCIHPSCSGKLPNSHELCSICYTSELGESPCAKLGCGHVYHVDCIMTLLQMGSPTLKIAFGFASCPSCKAPIDCPKVKQINDEMIRINKLKKQIEKMALKTAQDQGVFDNGRVDDPKDYYY